LRVEVFCEITFVIVCNGVFVIDGLGWNWVGLKCHVQGWVEEMMGWVGLGYENWTHGHVWERRPHLYFSGPAFSKLSYELFQVSPPKIFLTYDFIRTFLIRILDGVLCTS